MHEIRNIRQTVNGLLDSLEENVLQHCRAATKEHTISAMDDVGKIREILKTVKLSQAMLDQTKQQGSVNVIYAVNYNLEKTLMDIEGTMLELKNGCKQYGYDLQVQDVLGQLLEVGINNTESLACVKEKESTVLLPDYNPKKQVLINQPICTMKHNIALTGGGTSSLHTGVVYLPEHKMALVDNGTNSRCSVINGDFELLALRKIGGKTDCVETVRGSMKDGTSYIEFNEHRPVSITCLNNSYIAVSMLAMKKIYFLETGESLRVVNVLYTGYKPFALHGLKNGDLAVAWKEPWSFGIMSMTRNGVYEEKVHLEHDKSGRTFKTFRYLAVDESRQHVVQPCIVDQAVYCFDYCGAPIFTYTSEKLILPQGVDIDTYGNIFICDSRSSCIHVISYSGAGLSIILEDIGLYWPIAIAFKPDSSEFSVTHGGSNNQKICVCQLNYKRE